MQFLWIRARRRHPAYEALGNRLPTIQQPYAWYIRIPDLCGFLRHIQPVLEKRLAESIAADHSAARSASAFIGRVCDCKSKAEGLPPSTPGSLPQKTEGDAAFPGLTFLQLLFGYRSYQDLKYAFADCGCDSEEVRLLLKFFSRKSYRMFIQLLDPTRLSDRRQNDHPIFIPQTLAEGRPFSGRTFSKAGCDALGRVKGQPDLL